VPVTEPDTPPVSPAEMPASGWDIQAPYDPGSPDPIMAGGDADAGGRDDVGGSVAEAQANAEARYHEHESDTRQQGSVIGDLVALPPGGLDPAASSPGTTAPAGAYYDPPRDYGG
jgi:hypothetical protein